MNRVIASWPSARIPLTPGNGGDFEVKSLPIDRTPPSHKQGTGEGNRKKEDKCYEDLLCPAGTQYHCHENECSGYKKIKPLRRVRRDALLGTPITRCSMLVAS
ncbi:hypothetical protein PRIPAC_88042 [Pristionchus pacificus]|uniref:Uncharacterized protein n=1 Tax=Pristionchus pacificus TaxID=54126 RepID=A0A2A6CTU0_PRIPA|nr:hypothetical protein PRIPAC_88042 [Pristionchus pacificus]|eukprot:PDM81506.1 hypothetical protein PRIPAC_35382 [Pristionchus pacificus]